jgi:hypothetical protein
MKTRAVSLAILMLGATGVALADQDDHHWERDHDRGHGWTDRRSSPVQAPEIDPSSIVAALTLLGGGLAVLRGRRSKNSKDSGANDECRSKV